MSMKDIIHKCQFIEDEPSPIAPRPHIFKNVKVPPKQICVDHFKLVELDLPKNNHFK